MKNFVQAIYEFLGHRKTESKSESTGGLVSLRRQELVDITGHHLRAEILNYFLFRTVAYNLEWVEGGAGTISKNLMLELGVNKRGEKRFVDNRTILSHLEPLVDAGYLTPRDPAKKGGGHKALYRGRSYRANVEWIYEHLLAVGYLPERLEAPSEETTETPQEASNPVTAHTTKMHSAPDKNAACSAQKRIEEETKTMRDQETTSPDMVFENQQDSLDASSKEVPEELAVFDREKALAGLFGSAGNLPPLVPDVPPQPDSDSLAQQQAAASAMKKLVDEPAAQQLLQSVGVLLNQRTRRIIESVPLARIRHHIDALPYYQHKTNPLGYMLMAIEKNLDVPRPMLEAEAKAKDNQEKEQEKMDLQSFVAKAKSGMTLMFEDARQYLITAIQECEGAVFGQSYWALTLKSESGKESRLDAALALRQGATLV